jgi:opacity protein-like surface antigen
MKKFALLTLVLAAPAFAGTSSKAVIAPASDPCLTSWFLGGSVGYLTQAEEPMYNLHVGVTNSCWNLFGFNASLFGEVGYTEEDDSSNHLLFIPNRRRGGTFVTLSDKVDMNIVPVTLNFKLERALVGNLNAYFGAGLGVSWVDMDRDVSNGFSTVSSSESDWVFTSQVFAGLGYNVTQNCEIYGGARWLYLSNSKVGNQTVSLGSDCLLELGARYKF